MDIRKIISFLEQGDLAYEVYFSKKTNFGYESFSPNVDGQIFYDILDLISKKLNQLLSKEQIPYNPTGYRDGAIEFCKTDYIENYGEILESFQNPDHVETEIDPDDFIFYCLTVKNKVGPGENFEIKFFRRVTKFKKLNSGGLIARFSGNKLNKIEDKLIGLDGDIDLIVYNNEILILSHISLERIFYLQDKFRKNAEEFLNTISNKPLIQNFETFKTDCLDDGRFTKLLTKMSDEDVDMSLLIERFDYIEKTINMFEIPLEIEKGKNPKIIYSDKTQIYDILRILRDCYYISIIKEEKRIDNRI